MNRKTLGANDWVVIKLEGEIDLAKADELARIRATARGRTQNLVIDLSPVTFMDSTGLRWILETYREAVDAQREMRVVVPSGGQLQRLLAIGGAEAVLTIYDSLDEALQPVRTMSTAKAGPKDILWTTGS